MLDHILLFSPGFSLYYVRVVILGIWLVRQVEQGSPKSLLQELCQMLATVINPYDAILLAKSHTLPLIS